MTLRQIRDCEGQRRWQLDTNFIGSKKHMGNTCVPQAALGTVSFHFFLLIQLNFFNTPHVLTSSVRD